MRVHYCARRLSLAEGAGVSGPILIIGATSGIGACTVREAAARRIPVRAFARGAAALDASEFVEPMAGDALKAVDLGRALAGCSAVVYALGIKERLAMLWEEETLFSETTRLLISQMRAAHVTRLVAVTGFGAGRSRKAMSALERVGHNAFLGRPYADKDRQEALIMDSSLDWTIVRPVILTNGRPSGRANVLSDPSTWRNGLISRSDVARVLIDVVEDGSHVRADVVVAG
jgi:putative NADH-flavin reductase